MIYVLTGVHIVVSLFLIIVVLLQSGQAADLAGAFGGMGSQTVFGPRGSATVMSRATTAGAVIFMVTSLALAIIGGKRMAANSGSVIDNHLKTPASAPAKPATPAPAVPLPVSPVKVTPAPGQTGPIQQPNVTTKILHPGEKNPEPVPPKAPPKN